VKALSDKNSLATGLLIRCLPLLFFSGVVSAAFLLFGYLSDSDRANEESLKIKAEIISGSIDGELHSAMQTLKIHLSTWQKRSPETIKTFLQDLTKFNRGFLFHAVLTGKGLERIGAEVEFSDRYISELEFFELEKYKLMTSGFSAAYSRALDIWFEHKLVDDKGQEQIVRSLLRVSNYFPLIREILDRAPQTLVVIKPEVSRGSRLPISNPDSEAHRAKVPELNPTLRFEEISLLDEPHFAYSVQLKNFPAEVIYALSVAETVGFRPYLIGVSLGILFLGFLTVAFQIYRYGLKQRKFVNAVTDSVKRISQGDEQNELPVSGIQEFRSLAESLENLMKAQNENKVRSKVLNKSMFELFACNDATSAVMKCVELICTQCFAETSWFEPFVADQDFYRQEKAQDKAVTGWQWKNHRINEVDRYAISALQAQYIERHTVTYAIKSGIESIGTLRAYYENGVPDLVRLMLDSLISILEKTLARHDAIKKGVLLSTELDIAKTIQKSVVSTGTTIENDHRVAQFYKPADRLGGDWFYIIPNRNHDSCYVIMGSVSGGGISQGLLTSGVKGGLDVLDHLIRFSGVDPFKSPSEIIPVLQRIVSAMNKLTDSSITCFVAHVDFAAKRLRIANQGHSLPVIVRPVGDRPAVVHHLNGTESGTVENGIQVLESDLQDGDYLVAFSDGLTHAKGFKSEIFERFMVSALEGSKGYLSSTELRDDLKNIYNYYTSNKKQNDDVCFMVIKVEKEETLKKSA
jgi:serine phosphatase RsbU (regulator of sigma subunit)